MPDEGRLSPEISWFPQRMGGAGRLQSQPSGGAPEKPAPSSCLQGVWSQALKPWARALHPDLSSPSQSWLAFQKSAIVSSRPAPSSPRTSCAAAASLGTRFDPWLQQNERLLTI